MEKFKLTVLGSGGAFATREQGNSAFLVEYKDRRILIDCGGTVPYVLRDEMGIPLQSITDIIITHAHGDHTGGLEQLLYSCYFLGDKHRPVLWASNLVARSVLDALHPTMRYLNGKRLPMSLQETYDMFLRAVYASMPCGSVFLLGDLPLMFDYVTHVEHMPATSIRLGPLFVSGDTNSPVCPPDDVELVFHEAEFGCATGVHCPVDLLDIAFKDGITGNHHPLRSKTWLYHCPPSVVYAPEGFAGILKRGQVFELETP